MTELLGVADAKRRFAELLDRVAGGERIVITRHGKPAVALVRPDGIAEPGPGPALGPPTGFAALAGALAEVEGFEETMRDVVASRRKARDRPPADLG